MAVTATGGPSVVLFPGQVDPRFPIGRWTGDVSVSGDLSGGDVALRLVFRSSTDPALFLAFSLTYLTIQRNDVVLEEGRITINQFNFSGPDGTSFTYANILPIVSDGILQVSEPWPINELYLGMPTRGQNTEIIGRFQTNTNGVFYAFRAYGSLWLAEGALDVGGPQTVTSSVPTISASSHPSGSLQEVRSQRVVKPESVGGQALAPGAPGFVGPVTPVRVAPVGVAPVSVAPARPAIPARPTVPSRVTAGPSIIRPTGLDAQRARAVRTAAALAAAEKQVRARSRVERDAREALGERAAARSAAAATKGKSTRSRQVSVSQRAPRGMSTTTFSI